MFLKTIFASTVALAAVTAGWLLASNTADQVSRRAPGDCCELKLACCLEQRACCTAETKLGCCEQGLACCDDDRACCDASPDAAPECCLLGLPCCNVPGACCETAKPAADASAVGACCNGLNKSAK